MPSLLFFSLIGGLFSLIGGVLLLLYPRLTQRIMTPLISFGAGAFLGAVFLDILPEAIEQSPEAHPIFLSTLAGFVLFFVLERLVMKYLKGHHNGPGHSDHTESLPYLLIAGDSLHNFLDGIVIAIAFAANPALGLPTAMAIAAHEIPQEIGDFSILLSLKWKKATVLGVNVFQSLLTIPGVVVGYFVGQNLVSYLPLLLGGTAGVFLYIAASDLIPELHHRAGHTQITRVVLPLLISIAILAYLVPLTHTQ